MHKQSSCSESDINMNAPGKSYRTGMTLVELMAMFPDDETAEQWFAEIRWPDGVTCPNCDSDNINDKTTHPTMRYRCRACRKYFSVKTGTVMQSSKLGCQKWALALYLFNTEIKGVSSMKVHRALGVTQKTAWYLGHRVRDCWEDLNPDFGGPVEADEAYFGGEEGNKHASQRRGVGGGTAGKTTVAGLKDRATGKVKAKVINSPDARTLLPFVHENTARDATVYTDGSPAYIGLNREHAVVKHSVGEYVRGQAHTNGIESFWAMMKRGYDGTYHHMSRKHLGRYVNEFEGRHNTRPQDTEEQMAGTARGMLGKRLRYQDLVA